jgi:hypothetical protein
MDLRVAKELLHIHRWLSIAAKNREKLAHHYSIVD